MTLRPPALRLLVPALATAALLAIALFPEAPEAIEPVPVVEPPAEPTVVTPSVLVTDDLRRPAVDLSEDVLKTLRSRDWRLASEQLRKRKLEELPEEQRGDHAFLVAWSMVRNGKAADAEPWLDALDASRTAPRDHVLTVKGEVLLSAGRTVEALEVLEQVQADAAIAPRAAVQRAEALRKLSRSSEAWPIYEALIERPDPAAGNPKALLALAKRHGPGSADAYPHLRRLWAAYPDTEEEKEAAKMLAAYSGAAHQPTWQEVALRIERKMAKGQWSTVLSESDPYVGKVEGDSLHACRFLFARGRSLYKLNRLSDSIAALGDIGDRCVEVEEDYGARGLYLQGTASFRKKEYATAARYFQAIADLYPGSSYADDGLTHAGIALQEGGDDAAARALWQRGLREFPSGDTVPEATWRVAWSHYLQGDPESARRWATDLGALPLSGDATHVAAGRYWAARWALYPFVDDPTRPSEDPADREAAVAGWADLVEQLPHSFYAILAYSRLVEDAPDVARRLARRADAHDRGDPGRPWSVRSEFFAHPAVRDGVALARLGLVQEAKAEWEAVDQAAMTGDEMAWLTELRIANGDWLHAHDDMRRWMGSHPPGTLGPQEPSVLRVAFPDRYWEEVKEASAGYRYEPRLFHALVREESNFNRTIVSHAGARGLSQLMPATARQTAGWLGMSITMPQLDDPLTNLKIGARYLEAMHKQLHDSPYLSLAAYNAGAARVKQWKGAWGNVPTDEFVERIPFRETRGYVKRVMGTWQTMRWQFDEVEPFPDLSRFNDQVMPEG